VQIPSTKHQIPNKRQTARDKKISFRLSFAVLPFVSCLEFGAWVLGFGVYEGPAIMSQSPRRI
jgi:hypothetical protein